jgi:hypothetical protein
MTQNATPTTRLTWKTTPHGRPVLYADDVAVAYIGITRKGGYIACWVNGTRIGYYGLIREAKPEVKNAFRTAEKSYT